MSQQNDLASLAEKIKNAQTSLGNSLEKSKECVAKCQTLQSGFNNVLELVELTTVMSDEEAKYGKDLESLYRVLNSMLARVDDVCIFKIILSITILNYPFSDYLYIFFFFIFSPNSRPRKE